MRTLVILAAAALAGPALAQTAADPNAAPAATGAPTTGAGDSAVTGAAPSDAATTGAATSGAASGAAASDVTAQLTTGATVYDTQGAPVGTIEAVSGGNVVVSTGTAKASIPSTSFGRGTAGPVLAMTRAQLEAAVKGAGTGGR